MELTPVRLIGCCSRIKDGVRAFFEVWAEKYPDLELRVTQTVRSTAYQAELYAKGRTSVGPGVDSSHPLGRKVTWADGVHTLSNHQAQLRHGEPYGHAVDLSLYLDGKYLDGMTEETLAPYRPFRDVATVAGLFSGWDFPHGQTDPDHLQCLVVPVPVAPVTA
jgi:hypothetical protein